MGGAEARIQRARGGTWLGLARHLVAGRATVPALQGPALLLQRSSRTSSPATLYPRAKKKKNPLLVSEFYPFTSFPLLLKMRILFFPFSPEKPFREKKPFSRFLLIRPSPKGSLESEIKEAK